MSADPYGLSRPRIDVAALHSWNRHQKRVRDEYNLHPISTEPHCEVCGRRSSIAICNLCQSGVVDMRRRIVSDPTAYCSCGKRTWAKSGVCRKCQEGSGQ